MSGGLLVRQAICVCDIIPKVIFLWFVITKVLTEYVVLKYHYRLCTVCVRECFEHMRVRC